MVLRLLLVRHGQSTFNCEGRIQGRDDLSELTQEGAAQAKQLGNALKELPIHAAYSSPLKRAADTTTNLLKAWGGQITPRFDNGLLEVDLSPWSGLTTSEVKDLHPEEYKVWRQNPEKLTLKREDGSIYQPIKQLMEQAKCFLNKLLVSHSQISEETVLVVGHNAILRCLILQLIGEPKNGLRRIRLDNSSLSIIKITKLDNNNHQIQLECLNSTTFQKHPLPPKASTARLFLVRHGETDWNCEGKFQGQIDIPLNKNGHNQAFAAREFLSRQKIDRAYSSSLSRPKQTAEEILKEHPNINLEVKTGLIEIGHGLWEGKLESEINKAWPELLQTWKKTPEKVQMPEGESIHDVWERAVASWEEICEKLSPSETVLVVAHDAVNKVILCHLLGLSPSDIWMVKQGNGGITVIDMHKQKGHPCIVTCLNLTSHLGGVLDQTATGAL